MFIRKPHEYDIHKTARIKFYIFMIFLAAAVGGLVYYIKVYIPQNTRVIVATEVPDNTTWVDKPRYENLDPPILNQKGERDPVKYYNVIAQFKVEDSYRYQPDSVEKYDNIFVMDVVRAMGLPLPYFFDEDMMPAKKEDYEYTASSNIISYFFRVRGGEYGWKIVEGQEAQQRANDGYPTIAIWENPDAATGEETPPLTTPVGHVMVVRPGPTGEGYNRRKGPYIAHAYYENTMIDSVSEIFGFWDRRKIIYYTHD